MYSKSLEHRLTATAVNSAGGIVCRLHAPKGDAPQEVPGGRREREHHQVPGRGWRRGGPERCGPATP